MESGQGTLTLRRLWPAGALSAAGSFLGMRVGRPRRWRQEGRDLFVEHSRSLEFCSTCLRGAGLGNTAGAVGGRASELWELSLVSGPQFPRQGRQHPQGCCEATVPVRGRCSARSVPGPSGIGDTAVQATCPAPRVSSPLTAVLPGRSLAWSQKVHSALGPSPGPEELSAPVPTRGESGGSSSPSRAESSDP